MNDLDDLAALRAENARLIALLEAHGIEWRPPASAEPPKAAESSRLSTDEKVALFRKLFRGRTDVYPVRWESKSTGKTGYTPACANEWRAGVCEKPRIKCSHCTNRLLIPLSDAVIYDHLAGRHTVGVYPLLEDDTCHFLAVDFDEAEWRDDVRAFVQSCHEEPVSTVFRQAGYGCARNSNEKKAVKWQRFLASSDSRRNGSRYEAGLLSLLRERRRGVASMSRS